MVQELRGGHLGLPRETAQQDHSTSEITVNKPQHRILNQFLNILLLSVFIQLMVTKQLRKPFNMKDTSKQDKKEKKATCKKQTVQNGENSKKMIMNVLRGIRGEAETINKNLMLFLKTRRQKRALRN